MHTTEHQAILDSMTPLQKQVRTKLSECKKRGVVVWEWKSRFIIRNEFPHIDRDDEQYVLYERSVKHNDRYKWMEFLSVVMKYKDWHMHKNSQKEMSVSNRLHFHIYK